MVWNINNPQGNESEKIKWELVPYTRGRVLDLGCGPYKTFPHFIGVDSGHHDQHFGWKNNANIISECDYLTLFADKSVDAVFSSHLLEHIEDYKNALKEWFRVVKVGGYLCLYLPHKNFYPNIGQEGANPDHKHDFLPDDIIKAMKSIGGWDLVENQERNQGQEYSFFQVYKKRSDLRWQISLKERPVKTCAVIRYGAFGDLIMASSIMPGLKNQGYHVTLYTTPQGYEIVKHDPNIDEIIIQDKDQVPNEQLHYFWDSIQNKYDKVVNLSESVESNLLAIPTRINHSWPDSVRRKVLGSQNYLEWHHTLAEVPLPIRQKFYASAEEKSWAKKEREAMGNGPIILWSLSGSSLHKTWPHLDEVIANIMLFTKAKVVLVGDELCQLLERGWEKEPRVFMRSGKWSIRQSMAFCEQVDLIIGPETGLLNCAGLMEVPKICFLSHSSIENLTKHWKNTISLTPKTACYPCHRMHYNFDYCIQEPTSGVSQCMFDISGAEAFKAVESALGRIWSQAA